MLGRDSPEQEQKDIPGLFIIIDQDQEFESYFEKSFWNLLKIVIH